MTKETRTAWTVAAVLGIIVIILLCIMASAWYKNQNDLGTVLDENRGAVLDQREDIRKKCNAEGGEQSEACQAALQELSAILTEFTTDINRIQRATTTDTNIGGQ